ncbi:MAG: MFS transporter, partial [Paracoccaceae bacterium]
LIALFGLVAGQAVVWYTGQFYALFFMQNVIKVDSFSANVFVAWSLILGTGGFLFFGALSDKIGRKPIILAGCLIGAVTFLPVFNFLTQTANPALHAAHQTAVTVTAAEENCSFQFNPTNTVTFTNSCDVAKALLARTSVNYTTTYDPAATVAQVQVGETVVASYDAGANKAAIAAAKEALAGVTSGMDAAALTALTGAETALKAAKAAVTTAEGALKKLAESTDEAAKTAAQAAVDAATAAVPAAQTALDTARAAIPADVLANYDAAAAVVATESGVKGAFEKGVNDALKAAGYPLVAADNTTVAKANNFIDIFTGQKITIILTLTYLIILVTMVYGPIAALLVELFPTRIRYSGLSLPYHIGNGWFGGLMPATAFAISAQTGNIYAGLWYAIVVALMTLVIGLLFVPGGTHKKDIFADDAAT